jgi:hypothetical protein
MNLLKTLSKNFEDQKPPAGRQPSPGIPQQKNISRAKKDVCRHSCQHLWTLFSEIIAGTEDVAIAEIDAAIVSIAALTGYCLKRWSEAIDVMISKKADSKHVEKLRIIVLFHSLFNMLNKKVERQATQSAIKLDAIPSEAYARPGFRSNDCGLNKVLTYDIFRQRKTPAALCSNDAKSCYDRIVHAIANICLQRVGVQANTCRVMFSTLQQMKHHVKTAYGTSQQSYGSIHIPLQGVLQGNGARPEIWLLISSPLINMMLRTQGFGFQSSNILSNESYTFACYTYVDDTYLIHNGNGTTTNQIISDMQRMLDHWAGCLRATGGALVPAKSYWYVIDFKWNQRKLNWEYKSIAELPGFLILRDHLQ